MEIELREERLADYSKQRADGTVSPNSSARLNLDDSSRNPKLPKQPKKEQNAPVDLSPSRKLNNAISATEFLLSLPLEGDGNKMDDDCDDNSSVSSLGSSFLLTEEDIVIEVSENLSCSERLRLSMRSLSKQNSSKDLKFSSSFRSMASSGNNSMKRRPSLSRSKTADSVVTNGSQRSLTSLFRDGDDHDGAESSTGHHSRGSINFPLRRTLSNGKRFERTPSQRSLGSTDRLRLSLNRQMLSKDEAAAARATMDDSQLSMSASEVNHVPPRRTLSAGNLRCASNQRAATRSAHSNHAMRQNARHIAGQDDISVKSRNSKGNNSAKSCSSLSSRSTKKEVNQRKARRRRSISRIDGSATSRRSNTAISPSRRSPNRSPRRSTSNLVDSIPLHVQARRRISQAEIDAIHRNLLASLAKPNLSRSVSLESPLKRCLAAPQGCLKKGSHYGDSVMSENSLMDDSFWSMMSTEDKEQQACRRRSSSQSLRTLDLAVQPTARQSHPAANKPMRRSNSNLDRVLSGTGSFLDASNAALLQQSMEKPSVGAARKMLGQPMVSTDTLNAPNSSLHSQSKPRSRRRVSRKERLSVKSQLESSNSALHSSASELLRRSEPQKPKVKRKLSGSNSKLALLASMSRSESKGSLAEAAETGDSGQPGLRRVTTAGSLTKLPGFRRTDTENSIQKFKANSRSLRSSVKGSLGRSGSGPDLLAKAGLGRSGSATDILAKAGLGKKMKPSNSMVMMPGVGLACLQDKTEEEKTKEPQHCHNANWASGPRTRPSVSNPFLSVVQGTPIKSSTQPPTPPQTPPQGSKPTIMSVKSLSQANRRGRGPNRSKSGPPLRREIGLLTDGAPKNESKSGLRRKITIPSGIGEKNRSANDILALAGLGKKKPSNSLVMMPGVGQICLQGRGGSSSVLRAVETDPEGGEAVTNHQWNVQSQRRKPTENPFLAFVNSEGRPTPQQRSPKISPQRPKPTKVKPLCDGSERSNGSRRSKRVGGRPKLSRKKSDKDLVKHLNDSNPSRALVLDDLKRLKSQGRSIVRSTRNVKKSSFDMDGSEHHFVTGSRIRRYSTLQDFEQQHPLVR
ncbi:expressed unknown protein [Seminavis robusta]|uniref:Uncharacterized protein n=1 Tax=Seminavis robusta TaxID=568900 RepID=A0A9N8D7V6_9STRA|nr:expressed unknown protein [Seminavis robusta]|eukprot:Sro24_g016530.1 n/a (1080) ;mRNA; f:130227-133557